jgi:NAD-dependent deacetylase
VSPELDAAVAEARTWIDEAAAESVVVLTGAGISTDSGIPDFRGPQGVWTKNPGAEKLSSLQHYLADPELRKRAWRSRMDSTAWTARPNAGHRALVTLERRGRLHTLVTQNIDELHQRAGTDPEKVVEIHGTMRRVVCMSCSASAPMEHALDRVRAGEHDPPCLACGGILKSATISFGQALVAADLARAERAAREAEILLAVGSSLSVYPIAEMVPLAHMSGARVIIINAEPTAMDDLGHAVLRGLIGELLPAVVGAEDE